MIIWIFLAASLAATTLLVLPRTSSAYTPVMMKWSLHYLVPLDELAILDRGPDNRYVRVFDSAADQWVYVHCKTLEVLKESIEATWLFHAPCKTDLGFKSLRKLLMGPIDCEIFMNKLQFHSHHIKLIPPEILKGLTSYQLVALLRPLTIVELIDHYVDIDLIHVFWPKLFDRSGKCIVLNWHKHSMISSKHIGLRHLTMKTMLNGWDLLVPRLNLVTVLASLTQRMWDLFIEYMATICQKTKSEISKWGPMMIISEMGLFYDEFPSLDLIDIKLIVEHFCDREILSHNLIQRMALFLKKSSDPRFHVLLTHLVLYYWTNMVKIDKLSVEIINEYVVSRRIMGAVPFGPVTDPLRIHLSSIKETRYSSEVCNAILQLWQFPEFRRYVLASLVKAQFSSLPDMAMISQFNGIQRFDDFFGNGDFSDYLPFALLHWLDDNIDYVLPKQLLYRLCRRMRTLTEWPQERTMIHVVLIHQSQFFEDASLGIPDHVSKTILADIMLNIDPYYIQFIPNILQQLAASTNPFAYLRGWTDNRLCTPPFEFIVQSLCPENAMNELDPPLIEVRSDFLDLKHRIVMAAFHRRSLEFTSGAQIFRFQWWLSQRSYYHGELHSIILRVLKERFPESLSLETLMASYCDYFMVEERNWAGVWAHALTVGDGIIPINLLTILNLRKNQDISLALSQEMFNRIDGSEVVIFSLDIEEMHPYIISLIAIGNFFNVPEIIYRWGNSNGSKLVISMLLDSTIYMAHYMSKPHMYHVDWNEVAKALNLQPDVVQQMIALRRFSTNYRFFQDVLPRYNGLPISYLAQVFNDHDEDVGKTYAYLDKTVVSSD